jgi:hypothetical protein
LLAVEETLDKAIAQPYQDHANKGKEILEYDTVDNSLGIVLADDKTCY